MPNFATMNIIPNDGNSQEAKDAQAIEDRYAYLRGKRDAEMKLPRGTNVQSNKSRDISCYNMGYSYGEKN